MSAPTRPVGHEEYAALAAGWALDALEPADQDRFEQHRATCRDCEEEVAAVLRVAAELAYGALAISEERAGTAPTEPSGIIARGALDR